MSTIKHIRTEVFRVTQEEFGHLADATQGTVSRWESGELQPTHGHLVRIRSAAKERKLRWQDRWLFEVPQPPQPSEAVA